METTESHIFNRLKREESDPEFGYGIALKSVSGSVSTRISVIVSVSVGVSGSGLCQGKG